MLHDIFKEVVTIYGVLKTTHMMRKCFLPKDSDSNCAIWSCKYGGIIL